GDPAIAVKYLCKYLSKRRPGCLKRARLWSAFGRVGRTRVKDVVIDTPMSRLLRGVMGKPSVEQILAGNEKEIRGVGRFRPETNFARAIEKAKLAYFLELDPAHAERQAIWEKIKNVGLVDTSHPWSGRDIA